MTWGPHFEVGSKMFLLLATGILAFAAGRDSAPTPPVITVVDTVVPEAFVEALEASQTEVGTLRARLEGVSVLQPSTIIRTDTVFTPPDTVVQSFRLSNGTLTIAPLIRRDSVWVPEISTYTVDNCDESVSFQNGQVVCDPARLGHIWAGLGVMAGTDGVFPTLATMWKPSYQSPWLASVMTTGVRHSIWVQRSIQIF